MREIKFRAWDKLDKKMIKWRDTADNDALLGQIIMFPDEEMFTLMQYTGLKDTEGKEIYEGDIVKSQMTVKPWAVEWNSEYARFDAKQKEYRHLLNKEWCEAHHEIIGNIYENPELLKEAKR